MRVLILSIVVLTVINLVSAEINRLSADLLQNGRAHHTDKYQLSLRTLIVRRGGDIALTISGRGEQATIKVQVKLGDEVLDHFDVGANRPDVDKKSSWSSTIDEVDRDLETNNTLVNTTTYEVSFRLHVPVRSPIGQFDILVSEEGAEGRNLVQQAYILFNPWNSEDETYLISESDREEYVLNDVGKVYTGEWGKDWVFGQFHENVLPAVMMMLSEVPALRNKTHVLADPILLSRAVSAGVNANDGFGVLVGNWGGNYRSGTNPSTWASSVEILEKYYNSGGVSVKYGQCWVFGAVTTTALRTLGIPARSITTLGSAHDTDNSLTIDHFYDEDMNEIEDTYGDDSIWNFHSWTEAWMSRPDITNRAAGGWQVVDATPQELSDGIFQTGPASISGIKRGDIDSNFDMHFIFSEVQSVETRWKMDPDEPMGWKRLSADPDTVGYKILTKVPGSSNDTSDDTLDITSTYKYPDLRERRFALLNAAKRAGVEILIHDAVVTNGVEFTLSPLNVTQIGEPITGFVEMVNNQNQSVSVNTKIRIDSTYYNDVKVNRIATVGKFVELAAGETQLVPFHVPFEDYYSKLVDQCFVEISATSIVVDTDQIWVRDVDFSLKTPPVEISVIGKAVEGAATQFRVTFTNPLPIRLTECKLRVHGTRQYMKLSVNEITPGEKMEYEVDVSIDHIPLVIADLDCAQVTGMTGSTTVTFAD